MRATSKFTEGLGKRFRLIRVQSGLSQVDLGERLAVTRQSISGYENERLLPSPRVLESMCDHFGVNPWWLVYGVGAPTPELSQEGLSEDVANISAGREQLTHSQLSLIGYIMADKDAAQLLAKQLWDKALKL